MIMVEVFPPMETCIQALLPHGGIDLVKIVKGCIFGSINCQCDGTCARIMTILRAQVDLVTFYKPYLQKRKMVAI